MPEVVYPPVIGLARLLFLGLRMRIISDGGEHVPREGGAVLVCNHVSYLDFIFCGLAARPSGRLVRFMAKEAVFTHPVSGPLMRGMKHISVDRDAGAGSYRQALQALRAGEVVGVFPEATISRSFQLKEFKTGAVRLAIGADVPLVPVVTWGGQRLLTKGHPRQLRRGVAISVAVGEPLHPRRGDNAEAVTKDLHERMAVLLERVQTAYPDEPSGPSDRWWQPAALGGSAPTPQQAARLDEAER